jgi:hypothetical protein
MKENISPLTKVIMAINAIDEGTANPVVDNGCGPIYLLNTSNKELGNLIWTTFDRETFFPITSWQCRFGVAMTIQQILYEPLPMRSELPKIVDQFLPDMPWAEVYAPMILPGCQTTYPTKVKTPRKKPIKKV